MGTRRKNWLALIPVIISAGPAALAGDQGWPFYGGDQGGRHFSQATQINTSNIGELDVAWVFHGRQYVVINSGGHHMFKRGYGDYLYAFALP